MATQCFLALYVSKDYILAVSPSFTIIKSFVHVGQIFTILYPPPSRTFSLQGAVSENTKLLHL